MKIELFLLCNCFIFLLIYFLFLAACSPGGSQELFFFFILERIRCRCCFYHTEVCVFFQWGLGVDWCEGRKWTRFLELLLSFASHWFTVLTEKKKEVKRRKLCVLLSFLYSWFFFPADCVLGEGKGVRGGASLLRMGPDTRMAGRTVPETRKCLEAHPQDLLFVFRLWHWLLQHLHFYTIMSLKKQYTVCLLLSKKMKPNFKRMLLCLRNARGAIKKKKRKKVFSHCSLRCSAVYTPLDHFLCLCIY